MITLKLTKECVKKKFGDNKGLYIFEPNDPGDFRATGHVTIWDGNTSEGGRHYYTGADGNATLYIFK